MIFATFGRKLRGSEDDTKEGIVVTVADDVTGEARSALLDAYQFGAMVEPFLVRRQFVSGVSYKSVEVEWSPPDGLVLGFTIDGVKVSTAMGASEYRALLAALIDRKPATMGEDFKKVWDEYTRL